MRGMCCVFLLDFSVFLFDSICHFLLLFLVEFLTWSYNDDSTEAIEMVDEQHPPFMVLPPPMSISTVEVGTTIPMTPPR